MMDDESAHYGAIDVELFRRKMLEKAGFNRKQTHSPIPKSSWHSSLSSGSPAETSSSTPSENQYAVPEHRSRSHDGSKMNIPTDTHVDTQTAPSDASTIAKSSCGSEMLNNGPTGRDVPKHITFELAKTSRPTKTTVYWNGERFPARTLDSRTPHIREYWESNARLDERMRAAQADSTTRRRPFGFPRWRSNDALSASLVASKSSVEIPPDSTIPPHRLKKREENEKKAQHAKSLMVKRGGSPVRLHKGKSLDSLTMQLDYKPWYDRSRIRESVSRESIADFGAAKSRFEYVLTPTKNLHQIDGSERYSQSNSVLLEEPSFTYDPNIAHGGFEDHDERVLREQRKQQECEAEWPQSAQRNRHDRNAFSLTSDQQLLLLFIKQNSALVGELGIAIPEELKAVMKELPSEHVELRLSDKKKQRNEGLQYRKAETERYDDNFGTHPQRSQSPISIRVSYQQRSDTLPKEQSAQRNGRYVKNVSSTASNNRRAISRRTYDLSTKQIPENKRALMQELDREKAGDGLIAAEIRILQDREEELKRSRSELGLPNLEDTIQIWKTGYGGAQLNSIRSAVSCDHLDEHSPKQLRNTGSVQHLYYDKAFEEENIYSRPMQRAYDDRWAEDKRQSHPATKQSYYEGSSPNHNASMVTQRSINVRPAHLSSTYRLQPCDDPDVMIYGPPAAHRQNSVESALHVIGTPAPAGAHGLRLIRYE